MKSTALLSKYFLALGATGFGGPVALVERMRRDLVDEQRLVTAKDFQDGVAFAQLAPGPLAAQLAMYIGWIGDGWRGAALTGTAFVLPSLAIVLALAMIYDRVGGLPVIAQLFYGVGAAVIAVIARSAVRLARATARKDPTLWIILAVNAAATMILQRESVVLVLASGLALTAGSVRGRVMPVIAPIIALPASATLMSIFLFFATSGLVVFGSGLAIIPFLHGGVVVERQWLTERQFLDAVAVAMITPGPVVITVAFIGSLVAGLMGGVAAAAGVFLPTYLVVVFAAPQFRRLRDKPSIQSFVKGVTAAAIGALLGAVGVMAMRTLTDAVQVFIAAATLLVIVARPRIPEPAMIAAAGIVGIAIGART